MPTAFQKSWHSTQYRPCALRRSINDAGVSLAGAPLGVSETDGDGREAATTASSVGEASTDGATLTWDVALHPANRSATATQTDPRILRRRIERGRGSIPEPYTRRGADPQQAKAGHAERGRPPGDVSAASPRRDARLRNGAVLSAALAAIEVDGGVSAVTAR